MSCQRNFRCTCAVSAKPKVDRYGMLHHSLQSQACACRAELSTGLMQQVPYMVAICMRRQALPEKVMPEWEEMCAVASAVQNLWLAATAHGIAGACLCSCVLRLLC